MCACNLRHWGNMHSSYQGGGDHLYRACLHPTTITWGTYVGNGEGSYWGRREGLPVFSNCLQSSTVCLSPRSMRVLMCPLQLLMRNMSLAALLAIPPIIHCHKGTCPWNSLSNHIGDPMSKWQCCSSGEEVTGPATPTEEPTHQKQREGKFLMGLKESCQEAFCWDSDLVQVTRQMYFKAHCPTFNQEGSHDLSGLFQQMVACADLLDSEIYEIQEVWTSQRDLQYANDALKSSLKGLQFSIPCPLQNCWKSWA